jgi:F0F1-type ATP synthase epsilon subunit
MQKTFHLKIQTPEKTIFEDNVTSILIDTEGGQVELLPEHTNFISTIGFGILKVKKEDHTDHVFMARHGSIFFDNILNECRVLVFDCEKKEEVRHESISEYMKFVMEKLENKEELNTFQLKYLTNQKDSLDRMLEVITKQK